MTDFTTTEPVHLSEECGYVYTERFSNVVALPWAEAQLLSIFTSYLGGIPSLSDVVRQVLDDWRQHFESCPTEPLVVYRDSAELRGLVDSIAYEAAQDRK